MRLREASLTSGRIALIGAVLLGWTPPGLARGEDARLPIPDRDGQAKSLALVRELYKEEFDRIFTRSQRAKMASKLLDQGLATRQDPTGRYVLLDVAMQTAVEARDVATAFRAIDEMARSYRVRPGDLKSALLTRMAESAKRKTERRALVASALEAIDGAIDGDDHAMAERLAEVALQAARTTRDGTLVRRVMAKAEEVKEAAKAYRGFQDALATLRQKPTDPEANLAAGAHYCFRKCNWDKGTACLSLGSDPVLKAVARRDLAGVALPSEMVDLADQWLKAAERERDSRQAAMLDRAKHWYQRALPELSGLTKQKVERQLEKIRRSPIAARKEAANPYVFASPKRPIAVDDHKGQSANLDANNVYALASPRPVSLDQTAVFYQAHGAAGHDTNGTISLSLDGNTWIPISEWTRGEMEAAAGRSRWHKVDFSDLEKELRVSRILIKFQYTSGAEGLNILLAVWSYEGE